MARVPVGYDDFDRSGAMGASWSVPDSPITCDGDHAIGDALYGTYTAIHTLEIGTAITNIYGVPINDGAETSVEAKCWRRPSNAGAYEIGVFLAASPAATWSTMGDRLEYYYSSATGSVHLGARSMPAGTRIVIATSGVLTWTVGTPKTLRVDLHRLSEGNGQVLARASLYVDGVHLFTTDPFVYITTSQGRGYCGLFGARTNPGAGSNPAGRTEWDLFRSYTIGSVPSIEGSSPSCPPDPTLTSIAIAGEGTSIVPLPVTPSIGYVTSRRYAARVARTVSGHAIRSSRASVGRATWQLSWSGITTSEMESLRDLYDDSDGSVSSWLWTPPSGSQITLAFTGPLTFLPTGPDSHNASGTAVELLP